jgi:hypothetical protein
VSVRLAAAAWSQSDAVAVRVGASVAFARIVERRLLELPSVSVAMVANAFLLGCPSEGLMRDIEVCGRADEVEGCFASSELDLEVPKNVGSRPTKRLRDSLARTNAWVPNLASLEQRHAALCDARPVGELLL